MALSWPSQSNDQARGKPLASASSSLCRSPPELSEFSALPFEQLVE
jgi:hypothetical protein